MGATESGAPVHDRRTVVAPGPAVRLPAVPWQIERRRWWAIVRQVWHELADGQMTLNAAGVAFFGFLAVFPALAAAAALYGLVFSESEVVGQMKRLQGVMPAEAVAILSRQAERLAGSQSGTLSFSVIIAFIVALWSANKGTRGIIRATNFAYDQVEERSFVRLNALSLSLTLGAISFVLVLLLLAAGVPIISSFLGVREEVRFVLSVGRWPLLAGLVATATAVLYALAPNRPRPKWPWLLPGAIVSSVLLLSASALFSLYVSNFGSYSETYGSFGAVAVFLLWLYLVGYVVLLGAELNAEVERLGAGHRLGHGVSDLGELRHDGQASDDGGSSDDTAQTVGARCQVRGQPRPSGRVVSGTCGAPTPRGAGLSGSVAVSDSID